MLNPVAVFQQVGQSPKSCRVDFEFGPTKHQLFLSRGHLVYARSSDAYFAFETYLVRKRLLSPEDLDFAQSRAREESKPVELILEEREFFPRKELSNRLASLIREILYDLFSWNDGRYSVHEGEIPPSGSLWVKFPLPSILDKGRQIHEKWQRLSGKVPKLEAVLKQCGKPEEAELSGEEWKILGAVNGRRNVYEVCGELRANRLQVLSRLALLLDKKLVILSDFKERSAQGAGGSKSLQFQTIETVFRNLFSVILERLQPVGKEDGVRELERATRMFQNVSSRLARGLQFESKRVWDTERLLKSFALTGNSEDLKSVLGFLAEVLKNSLGLLQRSQPSSFSETVEDLRAILSLAEERLPEFHLSLQTAVEKAIQSVLKGTANLPPEEPESEAVESSVEVQAPALSSKAHTTDTLIPTSSREAEQDHLELEQLVQSSASIQSLEGVQLSRPRSSAASRPGNITQETMALPDVPEAVSEARTAPPVSVEPPPTPAPPSVPKVVPSGPTSMHEVDPSDLSSSKALFSEDIIPAGFPEDTLEDEEDWDQVDGGEYGSDPRRRALIMILVFLIVFLTSLIAASAYVLATNKPVRLRLQRALRSFGSNEVSSLAPRFAHPDLPAWYHQTILAVRKGAVDETQAQVRDV